MPTVSVLIPTRNAARWMPEQLKALHAQTVKISEIVIIDSQSEDDTCALAAADPLCRVIPIASADFDHGRTRDVAARSCQSEYLWFLTQDAIPADAHCLEELLKAVEKNDIACAYARQIAGDGAARIEQLNRHANYPAQSFVRSAKDIESFQIRAFFLSNACCLYKRDVYLHCGGFQHGLPTNEDMLIAAKFLHHGFRTAYCATAQVWHTHSATIRQWYQRSFDTGAFMELFYRELGGASLNGTGWRYAFTVLKPLMKEGRVFSALHFLIICAARYIGNRRGRQFAALSERAILKRTGNPAFWKKYLNQCSNAIRSAAHNR